SSKGMIRLLKALKNNGIMMILPDQAPRLGAGIYTPFFGHPAYTMTLLHKFINKTDATLLFGYCLRSDHQAGFEISIEQAEFGYKDVIVEEFNHRLNHRLEKL
ncbi:MAG: lysophospholipid acyltransferase family protein, partial [Kangiellaceae bacterium]|nr:lysophospholipid acyltransferase family protein [Kangiellaceae bacterium]